MEFERTLFTLHSYILSQKFIRTCIKYLYRLSIVFSILSTAIFLYSHFRYNNKSQCLQSALGIQYKINPEVALSQSDDILTNEKILISPHDLVQVQVLFSTYNLTFELSGNIRVLLLDSAIKKSHNFTQHHITVNATCYNDPIFGSMILHVLDIESIIINEILTAFKSFSVSIKSRAMAPVLTFPQSYFEISFQNRIINMSFHIICRLIGLFRLAFGLFLASNISAIFCRGLSMLERPANFLNYIEGRDTHNRRLVPRYTWITNYLKLLNRTGRPNQKKFLLTAFIGVFTLCYCLWLALRWLINPILFAKTMPFGVDNQFYSLIFFMEYMNLIFARTRTSIKYLPKFTVLIMMAFLYYVNYTNYGFYKLASLIMIWSIHTILFYFLINFEIPALDWNPHHHYTPSPKSPRTLYLPLFSLEWYYDIPPLWTMFYPLFGRKHFNTQELALVDGNYSRVSQLLQSASNQGIRANTGSNSIQ